MTRPDDETIAVREAESVDASALQAWLTLTMPTLVPAGARLDVRQYPAGFSNLTYRITLHVEDGERACVLRRPPRGVKAGVAHDMAREYGILAALHPLGVPVPRPITLCQDEAVIGAPFYVMEHVDGVILRGLHAAGLDDGVVDTRDVLRGLSETFVETLTQLHSVKVESEPLSQLGRPEGYVQRQVQGWTRRWHSSRTSDVPAMDTVGNWLEAHRPPDRGASLVHNDFKFDNLVLDPTMRRVVAILDWEMASVGDPLMDLGTSLAYWVQNDDGPVFRALGLGVTAMPGSMRRAELVQAYATASGRDVSDVAFYYAFGLFKVAVIAQQIYARHVQGLTSDPRFASLGSVVTALALAADRVTRTGDI